MPTQLINGKLAIPTDGQAVDASGRLTPAYQQIFEQLAELYEKLGDAEILTLDDLDDEEGVIKIGTENLKDDFGTIILQRAWVESTASGSITVNVSSSTIPTVADGTEVIATSFTPKREGSRIRMRWSMMYDVSTTDAMVPFICVSGIASAVAYSYFTAGINNTVVGFLEGDIPSWGASAQTVSVRVGSQGGGTVWYNRFAGSVPWGGQGKIILSIEEYMATPIPAA